MVKPVLVIPGTSPVFAAATYHVQIQTPIDVGIEKQRTQILFHLVFSRKSNLSKSASFLLKKKCPTVIDGVAFVKIFQPVTIHTPNRHSGSVLGEAVGKQRLHFEINVI